MIKPLLRTIPSLSGNVKLACSLTDIQKTEEKNVSDANIRGAQILPATGYLWQKQISTNLINSSWEVDLPRFYSAYSDIFYKTCFDFNKEDMLYKDATIEQQVRARDFEFGVNRISYSRNGHQFSFFAPIYIDDKNDIPDYFLIDIVLHNVDDSGKTVYAVKKQLRVNIGINGTSKRNYIYKYLYNYVSKIDDNVAVCTPLTNQATYYGIDLLHSGFVTAVDNMMNNVYYSQNTIHNVDACIAKAYERNSIVIKQVLPICYNFCVDDILTDTEKTRYKNSRIIFSGAYYKDGEKLQTYDFLTDYTQYAEETLNMNPMNGAMQWGPGKVQNIMDVIFPSLNETRYVKYEFANKLAPWFCRWKMKHSDDNHPYTINNSWAFSYNQNSNYRYGQFPTTFNTITTLADYIFVDNIYNYNIKLPLGNEEDVTSGKYLYMYAPNYNSTPGDYYYIVDRYQRTMENYCSNWFSVVGTYDDSIFNDTTIWEDVNDDGYVYYNGILYNLNNLYNEKSNPEKIDKFAVIINPVVKTYDSETIENLRFSDYTLYRQNSASVTTPNVAANDTVIVNAVNNKTNYIYNCDDFEVASGLLQDEIRFDEIFKKSDNGTYIDVNYPTYTIDINGQTAYGKLNINYYDLNRYYALTDINDEKETGNIKKIVADVTYKAYTAEDAEMRKMINTYIVPNYGEIQYYAYSYQVPDIDVSSYVTYGYVMLPVSIPRLMTYDVVTNTAQWETYNTTPVDFYNFTHSSTVINIPDKYADMEYTYAYGEEVHTAKLYDIVADNTYTHFDSEKHPYMSPARVDGKYRYADRDSYTYSYISLLSDDAQPYFFSYLVNSTHIPYLADGFDITAYMKLATTRELLYNWKNVRKTEPMSYWAGRLTDWKHNVSKEIIRLVSDMCKVPEYEFVPALRENNKTVANNIFKERSSWTGEFYGDAIPQSRIDRDNDVLWADPYNFTELFAYHGKTVPENAIYKDMYVKLLNKRHLYYWYSELFKDADLQYDGTTDYNDFYNNKWYKNLYAVEKKTVYDYGETNTPQIRLIYTPVEKLLEFPEYYKPCDEITTYAYNVANDQYRNFLTFYNSLKYDSTTGFYTLPGFYNNNIAPWGVSQWVDNSYSYLISNEVDDVFINDQESYLFGVGQYTPRYENLAHSYTADMSTHDVYEPIKFELVYKKKMYRVDKDLFDLTNMSAQSDLYQDIYFYNIDNTAEQDQRYLAGDKKIDFVSDLTYMYNDLHEIPSYTYLKIDTVWGEVNRDAYNYAIGYYDTPHLLSSTPLTSYVCEPDSMLTPMFDDIFAQIAPRSLIYSHYTLHNITKADVVSDNVVEPTEIVYTEQDVTIEKDDSGYNIEFTVNDGVFKKIKLTGVSMYTDESGVMNYSFDGDCIIDNATGKCIMTGSGTLDRFNATLNIVINNKNYNIKYNSTAPGDTKAYTVHTYADNRYVLNEMNYALYASMHNSNINCHWVFVPTGKEDKYYIYNQKTKNYIQSTFYAGIQNQVTTAPYKKVEFEVKKIDEDHYYICSNDQVIDVTTDATLGLNCTGNPSGPRVKAYYIGPGHNNSYWTLQRLSTYISFIGNVDIVVTDDNTGKIVTLYTNYRYDKPDKHMMMTVSDDEKELCNFVDTYDIYRGCYADMSVKSDDLNYGDFKMSTKVADDGTTYGFYYINSYVNNTTNTFDLVGIANKKEIFNMRYVNYINDVNITQNPNYITLIYKQLLPFIKQQPLNVLNDISTVVYPKAYHIDLQYSPQKISDKVKETQIVKNSNKLRTMSLQRYFTAITPTLVPTSYILNEWRLKLKDVNACLLDTAKYVSTGDAPIYTVPVNINTFVPYNVYSTSLDSKDVKSYNNITSQYTPLEYKFYNASVAINLSPQIKIEIPGLLTYDQLLQKETDDAVFELFKNRLNSRMQTQFSDDESLFLFKKYNISYDSKPVGLNVSKTEKLYTLTIVFDLI